MLGGDRLHHFRGGGFGEASGIEPVRVCVGNLFTSLEMMGVTLTLMKMDSELEELMKLDAQCAGLVRL